MRNRYAVKSQRLSWARRAEGQCIQMITKWKRDKARPKRRPTQRREDRVNEYLKTLGIGNGGEWTAMNREKGYCGCLHNNIQGKI